MRPRPIRIILHSELTHLRPIRLQYEDRIHVSASETKPWKLIRIWLDIEPARFVMARLVSELELARLAHEPKHKNTVHGDYNRKLATNTSHAYLKWNKQIHMNFGLVSREHDAVG